MAANIMMDVLRKIQRDLTEQKDYMRNLHVIHRNINEKFNIMAEKFDQQQVTMERLEQQVKKNNTLLFGNDESEIFKDNEKYLESNKANQLQTLNKEANMEEMAWNAEDDNKKNDQPKKPDSEDARESIVIDDDCANERREFKDLITDSVKTWKALFEEQVGQLSGDLMLLISEINEIKELLTIKQQKSCVDETAAPVEKNNVQTVKISPAYFTADQISKLNSELKQITEAYQTSNFFPNIEVVPDKSPTDDHPVMKALRAGVFYEAKNNTIAQCLASYGIKLGTSGFKRCDVRDMLTEYPDLTLYEVVKEGLKSTNEWIELSKIYDFTCPHPEPRKIRCLETVQISPTYFNLDQITKLNSELKQITEKYLETNIFPNIEIVPNTSDLDNHPVMKAIRHSVGIVHSTVLRAENSNCIYMKKIKLDYCKVKEILEKEPLMTVYNFVTQYGGYNITNFQEYGVYVSQ